MYKALKNKFTKRNASSLVLVLLLMATSQAALAQVETTWMSVGSMHNWYANVGSEIEHGLLAEQQFGLRWPASKQYTDMQAAKGLWFGVSTHTDENGNTFTPKVVHVGPRVQGLDSFTPMEFKVISKYPEREVLVDGIVSNQLNVGVDSVDPNLPVDRMIVSKINTSIGLTVERRIMQFSQKYHGNYHIQEYTLKNTGNTDDDPEIELQGQTLNDLVMFLQNRYAVSKQTRFVIGDNPTGWGINNMIDRRGDGQNPPNQYPPDYNGPVHDFRATFSWHGNYPPFTEYDNIGGPIWRSGGVYLPASDTTGRLGAYQFVGMVTLHADASSSNTSDDPAQPTTMGHVHSDDPLTSNNDPFNQQQMTQEYDLMTSGKSGKRHAYIVEPNGYPGFIEPSGDASLGTSGGHSSTLGYGPYTIPFGEEVKIVIAEAADGIGRERAMEVGRKFKNGEYGGTERGEAGAKIKNEIVFEGRDSLFHTFERAIEAYDNGLSIPQPPAPPMSFSVISQGNGIQLEWDYPANEESNISGFEIYRANTSFDSTYYKVAEVPPSERAFKDGDEADHFGDQGPPLRGRDYYYYIVAVGKASENDGSAMTPGGPLTSSRYYTQSYDPANLLRPPGDEITDVRIVPNPFNPNVNDDMRLTTRGNRIAFYGIPAVCTIKIFTETGEPVTTIEHTNGSGDEFWDLTTDERQKLASGIYIVVIEDQETGETITKKLSVIL